MKTEGHDPVMSEASPAELGEAFIAAMGWEHGDWSIEVVSSEGVIRKVHAKSSSGRQALLERRPGVAKSDAA